MHHEYNLDILLDLSGWLLNRTAGKIRPNL